MGKKLPSSFPSMPVNPALVAGVDDPGDETQRNFRYQHAYGAILLIAALAGKEPYEAVWCEHHEDLLAERPDATYDAYQIKTRRAEIGDWTLGDAAIRHSIKRFVELHLKFSFSIHRFVIVSNAAFATFSLQIRNTKKLKSSLVRLLEAVQICNAPVEMSPPFLEVIADNAKEYDCTIADLFAVLKRTFLVKGPSRDQFESEVAHMHLPQLAECRLLPAAQLNAVRDELIQKIYGASSLRVEDPRQHLPHLAGQANPQLLAKRVPVTVVNSCVAQSSTMVFRYQTGETTIVVGLPGSQRNNLRKKFVQAGLVDHLPVMERRTLDTEQRLIALALTQPDDFEDLLKQLEGVVQAECSEAQLVAQVNRSSPATVYGPSMLLGVLQRLKAIAENSPSKVGHEPYECLVGIAGLLTEQCTVWWSERFNLTAA